MGTKTTIVILSLVAVLGAFIFFYEQGTTTTTDKTARKNRVFKTMISDLVERVEIVTNSRDKVVLKKDKDLGENLLPKWKIVSPEKLTADETTVRSILSAIDYLVIDRVVDTKKSKKTKFGLSDPRVKGSYTIRGETFNFKIGSFAPGDLVYLSLDAEPGKVYAVQKDFFESVNKKLTDLRSKKIISHSLNNITSIQISSDEKNISLKKSKDDKWKVKLSDEWVLADKNNVRGIISKINGLKAISFEGDKVPDKDLKPYGLLNPAFKYDVKSKDSPDTVILAGKNCPDDKNIYLTLKDSGSVYCVKKDSLSSASPVKSYVETALMPEEAVLVEKINLSDDNASLNLINKNGTWESAKTDDPKLDQEIVTEFLKALEYKNAGGVFVESDENTKDFKKLATLEIKTAGSRFVIYFRIDDDGQICAQRKGEKVFFTNLKPEIEKYLKTDINNFRVKNIKAVDAGSTDTDIPDASD